MSEDDHIAEVVDLERQLLNPHLRAASDRVQALLHPDFVEFGASGRVWNRETVAESLEAQPEVSGEGSSFHAHRLADDVVLITYLVMGTGGSLRSSIWVRDTSMGWRLRFHQGTPSQSI